MIEKHHIVFKSQGGLDFELNYKYLTSEEHRGDYGPHRCEEVNLAYKKLMQAQLEAILTKDSYDIPELINTLGLNEKQANKAFKKLIKVNGIEKYEVIRRLMGGRFYWS